MGRMTGKVALITGAARGQGRAHAVRLAQEGAAIVALDACTTYDHIDYPLPTPDDLDETARLVKAEGGRIETMVADVRDSGQLDAAVQLALGNFGSLTTVCANAGIGGERGTVWHTHEDVWRTVLDVNLLGVWKTVRAAMPALIDGGGGSIVLTSSLGGIRGLRHTSAYVAAKHGVVGLMRTLANEAGEFNIRVNAVLPGTVNTPLAMNQATFRLFRPDLENPTVDDVRGTMRALALLPTPWVESEDITNAVLWLASDESRFVTGIELPVDGGWHAKF
ncbi:mycofactocin-coupled SDR family oxidoreductase [Amycolatopsis pithecellobii]|uniref:Mycofactocin-coupled SDR family oxidoreductase n=1 Tax=Amycolatopsis pithecellobii TaxID=664692 RepID=A0A6N7YNV3_9PSEU|nr:mycofactocin-coupled SDR family oxidoreductase [Amycolatopsis pithecellobii]MTD54687.1 mycofactocin-coupled SDR family oxidoreductase [Amycolatopsis pithecellobii]